MKVGRTGYHTQEWGLRKNASCICGEKFQTINHLMQCPMGPPCTDNDLKLANEIALNCGSRDGAISYDDDDK